MLHTLHIAPFELHKTKQSPPAGKKYLRFHINGRSSYAAQHVKSRILNGDIASILSIDTFEQQCDVIKGMLNHQFLKNI